MSKADGVPEVFGEGDVTIVMSSTGMRLYLGTILVGCLEKVEASAGPDGMSPSLTVTFPKSHETAVSTTIEENARVLRAAGWVRVLQ
jgi:hypothetical protein